MSAPGNWKDQALLRTKVAGPVSPAAFPGVCLGDPGHPSSAPGMTLRDHYAGLAMSYALDLNHKYLKANPSLGYPFAAAAARDAYEIADAMLAARGDA